MKDMPMLERQDRMHNGPRTNYMSEKVLPALDDDATDDMSEPDTEFRGFESNILYPNMLPHLACILTNSSAELVIRQATDVEMSIRKTYLVEGKHLIITTR